MEHHQVTINHANMQHLLLTLYKLGNSSFLEITGRSFKMHTGMFLTRLVISVTLVLEILALYNNAPVEVSHEYILYRIIIIR